MCTVTYLPINEGFFLTSSRDEKNIRPTIGLQAYDIADQTWYFPKDTIAGGTWIGANDYKARCLLNGALENHLPNIRKYTKSRGSIVLESMEYDDDYLFCEKVDLSDVEPFTLLMLNYAKPFTLMELRWDGNRKNLHRHNSNQARIWSSVTLYNQSDIKSREKWFNDFYTSKTPNNQQIFDFHLAKHTDANHNNILMKREGGLQTVSVSQIINYKGETSFKYFDVIKNSTEQLKLNKNVYEKGYA